jgi:6-phosphogluconolactonase
LHALQRRPPAAAAKYFIHQIPNNGVWPNGVPPLMGAHLMASGAVAPVSISKGAGLDVYPPEVAYYSKEGDVHVLLHATAGIAAKSLARVVVDASEAAIKAKDSFTLDRAEGPRLQARRW